MCQYNSRDGRRIRCNMLRIYNHVSGVNLYSEGWPMLSLSKRQAQTLADIRERGCTAITLEALIAESKGIQWTRPCSIWQHILCWLRLQ